MERARHARAMALLPPLTRDPWGRDLVGTLRESTVQSVALSGNPLGDPASRPLLAWLPPGWPDGGPYRCLYVLQGFTARVDSWRNRNAYEPAFPERLDAAFAAGLLPPVVVVFVDAWTRWGGSQLLDSAGTGAYRRYLCEDVVAHVDATLNTVAEPWARGLVGKSSGGFAAWRTVLERPDRFGAAAAFAPDAGFGFAYLPDLPIAWRTLKPFGHDVRAYLAAVEAKVRLGHDDFTTLNVIGMASVYSPGPDGMPQLPWDARTGALDESCWARWLAHDPVRLLPQQLDAARNARALRLECGTRDEYRLDVGATQLHAQLEAASIPHHFELFEGGHGAMQHRYVPAMSWLLERMAAPR